MTQIRLGDLLVRASVVSEAQLQAALAEQKQWGGRLGTILVRMGVLTEDLLVKALARQLNLPRAPIGPTDPPISVPDAVLARVDRAICERVMILPIAYVQERRSVVVAVADPLNVVAIDDFGKRMGARLELMLAAETQLAQAIARVFSGSPGVESGVTGNEAGMAFIDNSGRAFGGASTLAPPQTTPPQTTPPQTTPPQTMPPQTMPPQGAWAQPPAGWQAPTAAPQTMPTQSMPRQGATPGTMSSQSTMSMPPQTGSDDLRTLANQQLRAVRALVELLIERGIISRAELQAWLSR